ncbi:MAG: CvpA family protein [Crocinitomicaceae bacterium]
MNYLDILLVIPVIIGGWRGFKKGFIIELFTLLALLVGIYAGIHFSDYMSNLLRDTIGIQTKYLPVIAFTLTFLLVGAMVFFGGKMIEKAIKVVALGSLNKIAGLVFGALKMLYILSAVLVILESIDEKNNFIPSEQKNGSLLYQGVKNVSLKTIPALKESELFLYSVE